MKKKKTVIHFEVDGAFGSSLHRFGDVDNDVADWPSSVFSVTLSGLFELLFSFVSILCVCIWLCLEIDLRLNMF